CNSGLRYPCGAGTYNPTGNANSSSSCLPCAATEISAMGSAACVSCPAGFECTQPNSQTACITGTYSLSGQMICIPCPSGKICPDTTNAPS
ncbi:hypothetical protein ACJMK2_043044, partial [Sinanodonta woodiana]